MPHGNEYLRAVDDVSTFDAFSLTSDLALIHKVDFLHICPGARFRRG